MPARVVLASWSELSDGDEDARLLEKAIADAGVEPSWQVWDYPTTGWEECRVVARSTWDYTRRRADRFADAIAARI